MHEHDDISIISTRPTVMLRAAISNPFLISTSLECGKIPLYGPTLLVSGGVRTVKT
jgi:hypothetical protein